MASLPFVETKLDRSLQGFRPYRDSSDLFKEIKRIFSSVEKNNMMSYFYIKLHSSWNSFNKAWLLKNFPIEKKVLKSWFSNISKNSFIKFSKINLFFSNKEISFMLLNYTLNGLV